MGKFNKKLFDTLTASEENFKFAIEIVENLHLIKEQLISDYWEAVITELNHLIAEYDEEFVVKVEYGNLYISLKKTDRIYVCLEDIEARQSLGVNVEYNRISQRTKYKTYIHYNSLKGPEGDDDYEWFAYEKLDVDLSDDNWILKTLPSRREPHVKKRAKNLFDFTLTNKKHIEYIKKEFF